MCDEECSLVERLARLDDSAWEEFCRKYSGPLLGAVRLRFGCSQELAEEVVHMTFVRCIKSIKTFDPARGRLLGWLNAIARNEAHTLLRKASLPGRVELDPEDRQWIERIDEAELPDEQVCRQELRSLVLDTVMDLSSHYRQVLVMKYLEHRNVADMAVILGESEKAVESRLTRSRLALKEQLCKRFNESAAPGGNWL